MTSTQHCAQKGRANSETQNTRKRHTGGRRAEKEKERGWLHPDQQSRGQTRGKRHTKGGARSERSKHPINSNSTNEASKVARPFVIVAKIDMYDMYR